MEQSDAMEIEDLEKIARELCRAECRAAMCQRLGRCLDSWPGCGGHLEPYLERARERQLKAE